MNKKLIAVAVAGALSAPAAAFAQASTVQIYGTMQYFYGYYDNGGAGFGVTTPASARLRTDALTNSESELGFKGEEALGGGLAAWFQCATSYDVMGSAAAATVICGRNSAIGLKGNWGNVYAGNYDTPVKIMMGNYRPFAISNPVGLGSMWNATSSNLGNGSATAATGAAVGTSAGATSFSRRQQNLITYAMPTMAGFDAMVAYSAANEATNFTSGSAIQKPRLYSMMVNYTNGPLLLGIGYERHRDYNPAGQALLANNTGGVTALGYAGGTDRSYQIGAAYTLMGTLKVSGIYTNMQYQLANGFDVAQNNWGVYGDWAFSGPHRIRAGYTSLGNSKGTAAGAASTVGTIIANAGAGNTGGTKYSLEYAYSLSKRTEVSLDYGRQNNDNLSVIPVGTGADGVNAGETQTFYGARIKHSF